MADPERTSPRVPVLVWPALAFLLLGVLVRDEWAYYVGGALLVLASLQWGRSP